MMHNQQGRFPDNLQSYVPPMVQAKIIEMFDRRPISFAEVGARIGAKAFSPLAQFIHYYGFEPDVEECQRLNDLFSKEGVYKKAKCFPVALMGVNGPVTLNCCRNLGCSSVLEPNVGLLSEFGCRRMDRRFAEHFEVLGHFNCEAITLDDFAKQQQISYLDAIFLDTQGSEYEIIQGGSTILQTALMIKVEMEFIPLYKDQPLFRDVDRILSELGFQIVAFENMNTVHRPFTGTYDRVDRGELYAVDGIYCRRFDTATFSDTTKWDIARILAYMLLLDDLGFHAAAIYIGEQYSRYCPKDELISQLILGLQHRYNRKNAIANLPALPGRAVQSLRYKVSKLFH